MGWSRLAYSLSLSAGATGYMVGTFGCRYWLHRHGIRGTVARGGVVRDDAVMSATTRAASAERQDPGPGFQRRVLGVLALVGLTAFLAGVAREIAHANVTINNILPGVFDTDRIKTATNKVAEMQGISIEQATKNRLAAVPAGRLGTPDEFGKLCAFLASQHAGYIENQLRAWQADALRQYLDSGRTDFLAVATPGAGADVQLYILGSSQFGAQLAAALGLPFSFASHLVPAQLRQALDLYRQNFTADAPTAQVDAPYVMAGVNALVAPTTEEAEHLFTTSQQMAAAIRSGRPQALQPPVEDITRVVPEELLRMADGHGVRMVGDPTQVTDQLQAFVDEYALDEVITTTYTFDPAMRVRSAELLADAWGLTPAAEG